MQRLACLLSAATVGLVLTLPATAGENNGPMAEEIRSMELCRQAVSLDERREGKLSDPAIICSIQYMLPPVYWQCVLDTMQRGPDLFSATRSCRD